MRRAVLVTIALITLTASASWAHLCNNIYRTPDRIIVKPEKPNLLLETDEQVRIFVRNNYPTFLHNVRLTAETDDPAVSATVEPASMDELVPGQKEVFTIQVKAGAGAREGKHQLKLSVGADNVGFRPLSEPTDDELIGYYNEGNASSWLLVAESLARRKNEEGVRKFTDEYFNEGNGRGYMIRALRAAGRTENEELVEPIAQLAGSRDGQVKGTAILALGMLKAHIDEIKPVLQDRDPFVCSCAATAVILADDFDPALPGELAGFLTHDDTWVRTAAAWGCAYAGNEDALKVLAESLHDGDPDMVVFAGDALLSLAAQQEKKAPDQATRPKEIELASTGVSPQALEGISSDRFFFNPSAPLPTASAGGTLRVQLYHTNPAPVHDVVLTVSTPGGDVKSEVIAELRPTEMRAVEVAIPPLKGATGVTSDLKLTLACKELKAPAAFAVSIPGNENGRAVAEAALAKPAGELDVSIRRFGNLYGFAWGIPLALVLCAVGWLAYRRSHPHVSLHS
jgi:hypothetical protein